MMDYWDIIFFAAAALWLSGTASLLLWILIDLIRSLWSVCKRMAIVVEEQETEDEPWSG